MDCMSEPVQVQVPGKAKEGHRNQTKQLSKGSNCLSWPSAGRPPTQTVQIFGGPQLVALENEECYTFMEAGFSDLSAC